MILLNGIDMSAVTTPPMDTQVIAGYFGGATPHIWTPEEWTRFDSTLKLPIYVPSVFATGVYNSSSDVMDALRRLADLGVPKGKMIACDFETRVNPTYVHNFNQGMWEGGYYVALYGSFGYVLQNPRTTGGYWTAFWDGVRPTSLDPGQVGRQYANPGPYDLDVFDGTNDSLFWGSSAPTPVSWLETFVNELPTLVQGASGNDVKTLQGLCVARGQNIAVDGQFGPHTEAAVRTLQAQYGIQVDGMVGVHTWGTLITHTAK